MPDACFMTRNSLQTQMAYHRGWHVHEDALPADLVAADVLADHSADAIESPAFAAVREGCLQLADEHILIVSQRAAGFEEPAVNTVDLAHLGHREIVQGQAGNDEIVDA